jgi:hypothetical protein
VSQPLGASAIAVDYSRCGCGAVEGCDVEEN